MLGFLALLVASVRAVADDPNTGILLQPPGAAQKNTALLVWVPGGLVPNHYYVPLMKKLQKNLMDKVNLWVSIAACDNLLCIPGMANANISIALDAGRNASGVKLPEYTWLGGHSLGGEGADNVCFLDGGKTYGGCILWGSYIFAGPDAAVSYPVPVLTVIPELDFGSARIGKMAPYWAAANAKGATQMLRTPFIVLPDVDHSDMCQGFPVPGDLPSASPPRNATETLTKATASFILSHMLESAEASKEMQSHIDFTKPTMQPMEDALELDLRSAKWCAEMQVKLAGRFAANITVSAAYHAERTSWAAPKASLTSAGKVVVSVTGHNEYESDGGLWPPASDPPPPVEHSLSTQLGAPAPMRDTATSLGCRLVSQTKIASLLGVETKEPEDFCHDANAMAWEYAQKNAPARALRRYHSKVPCNGCAPGVPVVLKSDKAVGPEFLNSTLTYNLTDASLTVQSLAYSTDDEHSCMLLSPARALDFLYFDAYQASVYPDSSGAASVVLI